MSTIEYIDLYEKAQNNINSKYHMFVFDIANSKTMDKKQETTPHYKWKN